MMYRKIPIKGFREFKFESYYKRRSFIKEGSYYSLKKQKKKKKVILAAQLT